jgi:Fe-S-cluster containining protein
MLRARRGRAEHVLEPPYTRRSGGQLMLRVLSNGKCTHLGRKDNLCGIYTHRPDACRYFPAGSECCLFAREEELGIVDGARN